MSALRFFVDPDITKAKTLSTDFYTDPGVFAESKEKIFSRCWHFLGSSAQLPNPGDMQPLTLLDPLLNEPLLLSRDLEGEINNQNLHYLEVVKWRNQLYNIFLMKEVMDLNVPYSKIDSFKKREEPLLSSRKEDFMQYANISQLRLNSNEFLYTNYENVFKKGESLLALLKKEYHLK